MPDEKDMCACCHEPMDETASQLKPCCHVFHPHCVSNWKSSPLCRGQLTCPLCRAPSTETDLYPLSPANADHRMAQFFERAMDADKAFDTVMTRIKSDIDLINEERMTTMAELLAIQRQTMIGRREIAHLNAKRDQYRTTRCELKKAGCPRLARALFVSIKEMTAAISTRRHHVAQYNEDLKECRKRCKEMGAVF